MTLGGGEESQTPKPASRRRRRPSRRVSLEADAVVAADAEEAKSAALAPGRGDSAVKGPPRRQRRTPAPPPPVPEGAASESGGAAEDDGTDGGMAAAADRETGSEPEAGVGRPVRPPETVSVAVAIPRGWGRRLDAKLIRAVVLRALELEHWQEPATLDVLFVRDRELQEINATRRGVDEETDVLSFPLMDLKPGLGLIQDFFVLPPDERPHLGDVVISVDRIEAQAKEAGHSEQREIAYLTVHGVLHILGYDHEAPLDRREMRSREEEVLAGLGLRRAAGEE